MKPKRRHLPKLLICLAIILLAGSGVVAWRQWQDNKRADSLAAQNQYRANHGHATGENPSTQKPSKNAFQDWKVEADQPRYITISKLNVEARVKPVGLTRSGTIGAPNNVYDAAWYVGSAKPGRPGAMLIDGHVSSWKTRGVFYDLKKLQPGDKVQVERGDGTVIQYRVIKSQVYDVDKVDMQAALSPINPDKPGLNIMTCAGNVTKAGDFSQRIVIFTGQL